MGIARIGMMVAAIAALMGMAGPARADLAVRIKNETNGEVIARIHAQDNAWTPWSEVLSQDQEKRYTFRNGASVFYIEFRYDDGREWRHVCTKSINADRPFQVVTRGPVPHMDCFVEPLGVTRTAQAVTTTQRRTVHAARHRTVTHARRTTRPARTQTAASPPAPMQTAALPPQPASTQAAVLPQPVPTQATPARPRQTQAAKPRRPVRHVRSHRTVATTTTTRTTRRQATPASAQIPTTPDTGPGRTGSYSREAACLDVRPAWDTPATWCHEGHTARDDLRPSRR